MNKWKKVKLGDIATYINGCAFKPSDWSNQGVPIVRIQNLTGSFSETNYYDKHYNSKYEINNGDVLISWSASFGVYVWDKGKAILNQHIFKVVFNKIDIDKTYFIFAIKSLLEKMEKQTHGATMKHITKPLFDNMEFPFPPMEEQKKIAARLDAVSDLLAKQKQLLSEQDNLIQSTFYDMFGDPLLNTNGYLLKYFDEIFSRIKNGANIKQSKLKNGLPITRIETISNYSVNRNRMGFAGINDIANYLEYELQDNDILISHINSLSHIGKSALYRKTPGEKIIHGMNLLCLRPIQSKVNPLYIKHLFKTSYFKKKILSITKPAVNQASFTVSDFKKLTFPLPPFELQQKFAAVAEQIESEKSKIKSAIAETQTLFNALMSEYFEE